MEPGTSGRKAVRWSLRGSEGSFFCWRSRVAPTTRSSCRAVDERNAQARRAARIRRRCAHRPHWACHRPTRPRRRGRAHPVRDACLAAPRRLSRTRQRLIRPRPGLPGSAARIGPLRSPTRQDAKRSDRRAGLREGADRRRDAPVRLEIEIGATWRKRSGGRLSPCRARRFSAYGWTIAVKVRFCRILSNHNE